MKKLCRRITSVLIAICLTLPLMSCSFTIAHPVLSAVAQYLNFAILKDYGNCYAMLSSNAQEKITQSDFALRHNTIFNTIALTSFKGSVGEITQTSQTKYEVKVTYEYALEGLGTLVQEVVFPMLYEGENHIVIDWSPEILFNDLTWANTIMLRTLVPKRGEILDSKHNAYAINSYAETVYLRLSYAQDNLDAAIDGLSRLLEKPRQEVYDTVHAERAQKDDVAILAAYLPGTLTPTQKNAFRELPGVDIDTKMYTPIRYYPQKAALAHAIGYTSPITKEELETLDPERYDISSYVGRTGLESAYEDILTGTRGFALEVRDKEGELVSTLLRQDAQDGTDVQLSIDHNLQMRAEAELAKLTEGQTGVAIALDPSNGDVLTIANHPTFDLNLFTFMDNDIYKTLSENPMMPLYNRAVQGLYAPGSTLKPFMAAMALKNNIMAPQDEFTGRIVDRKWTPGAPWHWPPITRVSNYSGPINMQNALVHSDNIYFAYVALKSGWDIVKGFMEDLGFGSAIPYEQKVSTSSYMRSNDWENRRLLANTGYGQGEVLVAPLQMASLFEAFINDGVVYQPTLVKNLMHTVSGEYVIKEATEPTIWKSGVLDKSSIDIVEPMLQSVVNEGSAKSVRIQGLDIYGKTGTAEVITNGEAREIAWIIAYVAGPDYQRLVCAMVDAKPEEGSARFAIAKALLEP